MSLSLPIFGLKLTGKWISLSYPKAEINMDITTSAHGVALKISIIYFGLLNWEGELAIHHECHLFLRDAES